MPDPSLIRRREQDVERPSRRIFLPLSVTLLVLFLVFFPLWEAKPQPCVVLLGDSITSLWQGLAGQLSGLRVINRGVPGDVTSHMRSRFERDVLALRPRVVVILGGINDLERVPLASIEQNLEAMAEQAERHGIRVVLATVPPAGEHHPDGPEDPDHGQIQALNRRIESLAERKRYTLVDYHSVLSDHRGYYLPNLSRDGVHPSLEGYERMEHLLREALEAALSEKPRRIG